MSQTSFLFANHLAHCNQQHYQNRFGCCELSCYHNQPILPKLVLLLWTQLLLQSANITKAGLVVANPVAITISQYYQNWFRCCERSCYYNPPILPKLILLLRTQWLLYSANITKTGLVVANPVAITISQYNQNRFRCCEPSWCFSWRESEA